MPVLHNMSTTKLYIYIKMFPSLVSEQCVYNIEYIFSTVRPTHSVSHKSVVYAIVLVTYARH